MSIDSGKSKNRAPSIIIPGSTSKSASEQVENHKRLLEQAKAQMQQDAIKDPITQQHWHYGKVRREGMSGEGSQIATNALRSLAAGLKPNDQLTYAGSLAVHVYYSEALSQCYYVEQVAEPHPGEGPRGWGSNTLHRIYDMAMESLRGCIQERFSGKRSTRRSGF